MTTPSLIAVAVFLASTTGVPAPTDPAEPPRTDQPIVGQSTPLRPAEVVAARVRAVLQDHANGQRWQELAGALPEMAVMGGADIESTFEAARLAEAMVAPVRATPTSPISWDEVTRGLNVIDVDMVIQALAIALGLFALWMAIKSKSQRAHAVRTSASSVRYREARSLAAAGIPLYEIARRTGLARDAVSVLLTHRAR